MLHASLGPLTTQHSLEIVVGRRVPPRQESRKDVFWWCCFSWCCWCVVHAVGDGDVLTHVHVFGICDLGRRGRARCQLQLHQLSKGAVVLESQPGELRLQELATWTRVCDVRRRRRRLCRYKSRVEQLSAGMATWQ